MKIALAIIVAVAVGQVQAGPRITGGTGVAADSRSTVAIFSYTGTTANHICSGVIIHPEWILTSATCVKMVELYDMRVTTKNIDTVNDAAFNDAYLIKNKIAHPSFAATTLLNDIGLIQLEDHISSSERILKLPQVATDLVNTQAIVRGYGERPSTGKLVQTERAIYIVDNTKCVDKEIPMTNKICTTKSAVACKGDEGGPLITADTNIVVGIVSLNERHLGFCGYDDILTFTAYTNVWQFKAWIRQTTGLNL